MTASHTPPPVRLNKYSMGLSLAIGCFLVGGATETLARPNIKDAFLAVYPSAVGSQLDTLPAFGTHCGVCHYDFNGAGPKNPYGNAIEAIGGLNKEAGRILAIETIRNLDSDTDSYPTDVEVTGAGFSNTPTFPGLSSANVGSIVNISQSLVTPYLTPTTTVDTTPPSVTLSTPNGGETLTANTLASATWTASDSSGIANVQLLISIDGGTTYTPLILNLSNTGTADWFPANRPTTQALLKVIATDGAANVNEDVSDGFFTIISPAGGIVQTTLRDFDMPGSQPFEGGPEPTPPENCAACHGNYDDAVEPYRNWRGSMMALASLDPLFEANMAIANQDAPDSGDLCLRCHISSGWLQGRSVPTDGSAMLENDMIGVSCDLCHRMVDPVYEDGVSPLRDLVVLGDLSFPGTEYGNGMFVLDPSAIQRGPFDDAGPPHLFNYSPFHKTGEFCGTCHDVSNPAFLKDGAGIYQPNALDAVNTDFSALSMAPVERTYSEWANSAYNTPLGVYAPEFAGNKPGGSVSTCQDCHMRDVAGYGANYSGVPFRQDVPLHDMTGGSTWIGSLIAALHPDKVDHEAVEAAEERAEYMLQNAADLSVERQIGNLVVRVTNQTGHKLPTGYPEGRRVWVNVKFYDSSNTLISESGAYDPSTGVLSHDPEAKIYEVHPGIDNNITGLTGLPEGPSLHFVLNNKIFEDNRIPPRGFNNAVFAAFGGAPVGHSYADGQYWDDTPYTVPAGAKRAEVNLYYQSTSKEFIEFLRDENTTNSKGQEMYDLWNNNGKCPPTLMATADWQVLDSDGDEDGDGLSNLEERAFGSDAWSAVSAHRPASTMVDHEGTQYLGLRFVRLKGLVGTQINVMKSTDLLNWDPADADTEEYSVVDNLDGTETVVLRMLTAPAPGEKQFLRLSVVN